MQMCMRCWVLCKCASAFYIHSRCCCSGGTEFQQLIFITFPILVLLHVVLIYIFTRVPGGGWTTYACRWSRVDFNSGHPLAVCLSTLFSCMLLGTCFATLNAFYSAQECLDFLTQTTTAAVDASATWQVLFTGLNCLGLVCTLSLCHKMPPNDPIKGRHGYRRLQALGGSYWLLEYCPSEHALVRRALVQWRTESLKLTDLKPASWWREPAAFVVRLIILLLAMMPAMGYVSASGPSLVEF